MRSAVRLLPRSGPKHLFGLSQNKDQRAFNDDDDYEHKYSEDPIFRETGPNARVWRTYLAESAIFDENMIGEVREGLDSLLVFAGLFSAVVTSFLLEASQYLQTDYTRVSADLRFQLVSQQNNGMTGSFLALDPGKNFVPDARDVWVNGLWAVSLTFSLVVALASVLIKQWLRRYLAFHSGTPAERSHLRQYRFMGFKTWQVSTIVGSLPVIMHLSLALFLAGLILFFIPLHFVLSCIIGSITLVVYVLYVVSNILPIFFPQCPYRTPFSAFLLLLGRYFFLVAQVFRWLRALFIPFRNNNADHIKPTKFQSSLNLDRLEKSAAESAVEDDYISLSIRALHWLYTASTNTSVHSVVLQAIGGLPAREAVKQAVQSLFNFEHDCEPVLERLISSCTDAGSALTDWGVEVHVIVPIGRLQSVAERLCRTLLFFPVHPDGALGLMRIKYESNTEEDPESDLRKCTFLSAATVLPLHDQHHLDFVLNNRSVRHHFFVWEAFLKNAGKSDIVGASLRLDSDSRQREYSTQTILSYYDDFFIVEVDFSHSRISAEVDLMAVTSQAKYAPLIRSWMLRILASYDLHPDLPEESRIIESMLRFLLHRLWNDISEHTFWYYVMDVFERFDVMQADWEFRLNASCDFSISSFIIQLGEKWISRPKYRPSALEQLLAEEVKTYWRSRPLGKAEVDTIRGIGLVLSDPGKFTDFAPLMTGLLDGLRHGSIEAHHTFVNNNYLTRLFEHYTDHPSSTGLLRSFVCGLQAVQSSTKRAEFVNHLFEPQNARYALILMIVEQQKYYKWPTEDKDVVMSFARLCPERQWLVDHRDWLMKIITFLEEADGEVKEHLGNEIGISFPSSLSSSHAQALKIIQFLNDYLSKTQLERQLLQMQQQSALTEAGSFQLSSESSGKQENRSQ
ncbi:hypothetical protein D9757_001156 [Collybiopsis confluens]|uniref:DUF6535 domain-containing protein n=1 Tax=Collybiopsis confluens TaxID=2823264 RepID=A0A8H5MGQ5_9AGAR|nr:hypothetical protein D9757_001156 [Collybiopsis confluens]